MITEIKKYDRLLAPLRFVAAAVNKEPTRYALNYLHVKGELAIATDGKRMHWIEHELVKRLKTGFYKVLKNTKTMLHLDKDHDNVFSFPKYEDIIPEHVKFFTCNTEHWPLLTADLGNLGIGANPDFMKPFSLLDCEILKVSFGESDRPIKFSTQEATINCHAVIMPVNYKKPEIQTETA